MKLSIIIPIFNEEKTIQEVLKRVASVRLPFIEKEIVIVDDASTDGSKLKIQNSKLKNLKRIFHQKNMGKGAAIRSALKEITGDYIIIQDADLEYNPKYYPMLMEPILKDEASVVYGDRLSNYPLIFWGKGKSVLPVHLIANKLLTLLTNILYGGRLNDMETGYKIFKKDVLIGIELKSKKFDFEAEVTAKIMKKGIKILEVPIKVTPRTYEEGKKIGWRDGVAAIWSLIKYKFTN